MTYNYQGVGMQALVNAVRAAGASNVAIVAGMIWGFDLSQVATFPITDSANNLAYDTHPYDYSNKQPASWDSAFGFLTSTSPVMSLENGEYDCGTSYMSPLLSYFDAHQMSWVGWSWYAAGSACGYPRLITDYQGTPAVSTGTLLYQQLLSYTGQGGPISTTWYFAEGRAGGGFERVVIAGEPQQYCLRRYYSVPGTA